MKCIPLIAAIVTAFSFHTNVVAGQLLDSTDKYMGDKAARVAEIQRLCRAKVDASKGGSEWKRTLLNVCAFDTGHTTGFNAITQDKGKVVDLIKVQTPDYTLGLINTIQTEIKACQGQIGLSQQTAIQSQLDNVTYCVSMRGYEYGKRYGQKFL